MPLPFSMGWGGAYSTYVRPVRPIRNTNGLRAISFEEIGVLD